MTDDLKCPRCNGPLQLLGGDRRRPWYYCPTCGWSPEKLIERVRRKKP